MELRRELGAELRATVRELNVPVIMVTHSREEALALGDTVQIIDAGRVVAEGSPLTILEQPGQGRVARLVGWKTCSGCASPSACPRTAPWCARPENARWKRRWPMVAR